MGASVWSYSVPYQEDLNAALAGLKQKVLAEGDYWWAGGDVGKPASAYDNRPTTIDELDTLADQRWFGRCAILHDAGGRPEEIYFWGYSGD